MKKIIMLVTICSLLAACQDHQKSAITIGIVEPLEHVAMNEIVDGFRESIQKNYTQPVIIKVENAQNDMNLQRAIIQKMKDAKYDLIVPIGIAASQMALSIAHQTPIVSLANNLSEEDRAKLKSCQLAVVDDEISSARSLALIKQIDPSIKNIILIHSAAEKVLPEVETAIAAGKTLGITVHHRMVTTLPELYTTAQSLSNEYDAIFILKDHLIVSGVSTLSLVAQKKHIPLIASDEGSLHAGADIAVGVLEKQIGIEGGKLAAAVLQGKTACQLPIVEMTSLSIFINKEHAFIKSHSDAITKAAAAMHYSVIPIDSTTMQ